MTPVNTEQSLHEINYTWLSLAQKMLLKDRSVAMFRLGLNARVANIIGGMTEKELHKLSTHPHFIFTLRIQDPTALECLLQDSRVDHFNPMHAAILCLSDTGGGHGI
ncbi:flagellar transcriptional regulator FlhD [Salmonella enterica subsp. enterica serovar Infantis]|nr:flagellar transcriptional regulator FlhD [Salmonella enterica subsp. enterica serovar Infantis]